MHEHEHRSYRRRPCSPAWATPTSTSLPSRVGLSVERDREGRLGRADCGRDGDQVRAGAAAWVIESGDARIVVDPAASPPTTSSATTTTRRRTRRRSPRCSRPPASRARASPTRSATHYEGVGMLAWRNDDGSWDAVLPERADPHGADRARRDRRAARSAWASSRSCRTCAAQGAVRRPSTDDPESVHRRAFRSSSPAATTPGHQIVRVDSAGEHAVIVGHLAVERACIVAIGRVPAGAHGPDAGERAARQAARRRRGAHRPALARARRRPLGWRRGIQSRPGCEPASSGHRDAYERRRFRSSAAGARSIATGNAVARQLARSSPCAYLSCTSVRAARPRRCPRSRGRSR